MSLRPFGAGIAGGLLAGAALGVLEALASWLGAHGAGDLPAIGWALAVYGLIGALGGLGAGIVAAVLRTDGFGPALAGVGAGLGFVVARFRIIRDVFLEQLPPGPLTLVAQLLGLVLTVALAVLVWRALRGAAARRSWLTRPGLAAGLVAVLAVLWTAGARVLARPAAPVAPPRAAAAPAGAPNVVLLMIDTLRADRLGVYGNAGAKTPAIDALAADGVRGAHTFAQASWTRPSVATILTGLYPSSHGAVHKADILPDRVDTTAELLAGAGYYTAGFANNVNVSPGFNFGQGFAEYRYLAPDLFFWADESAAKLTLYNGLRLIRERFLVRRVDVHNYYQPAEVVTDTAIAWLDSPAAKSGPFFLFLHYMDPHDPYFVHPFNGEGYARVANPNPPAAVADKYLQLYDGEIAYLDEQLGRLFADLKRRGLYDTTLIVLTADHGEEFHEHGGWWHGTTLYDEQIHVPLLMKPPQGGRPGRLPTTGVVEELTTSLDIAPTILTAAGVPVPAVMQGHPLPLDGAPAVARESVFSEEDFEGNVLQSVRTPVSKLITANPGNPRGLQPEELYDVKTDPGEQRSLVATEPVLLEELRAALGRSYLAARAHAGAGAQTDVDSVTKDRLRALGYLD
jgi:arylsulfatase A-like enzyme